MRYFKIQKRLFSNIKKFVEHEYDAIVIGAGGAGLRATMGLAEDDLFGIFRPRSLQQSARFSIWSDPWDRFLWRHTTT